MNSIQWIFFLGTVVASLAFTCYGQWVVWKYAVRAPRVAVTGCEVARFILDQRGFLHVSVTPLAPTEEWPSSEGLFLEPRIYEGRDLLSILRAAQQAFLKSQLSNVTFWMLFKKRIALVVQIAIWSGWGLLLLGNIVPGLRFFIDLGLGCFTTVMIFAIFDLPFELEIEEKTSALLRESNYFQLNEAAALRKLNRAVSFWGLSWIIRTPFNLGRLLLKKNGKTYGI